MTITCCGNPEARMRCRTLVEGDDSRGTADLPVPPGAHAEMQSKTKAHASARTRGNFINR
jgi:hypothetical protein